MRELQVNQAESGMRLDKLLLRYMEEAPKSFIYKMLRKKNIKLNGKKAEGNEKLQCGDRITLYLAEDTIESFRSKSREKQPSVNKKVKLEILFEDENFLVINKPVGMLSQKAVKEDVSLVEYVTEYLSEKMVGNQVVRPGICNRLDRNTSGIVVAGKSQQGLQWANQMFRERTLQKYYLCIVCGKIGHGKKIQGYLLKDEKNNTVSISENKTAGGSYIETEYEPMQTGSFQGQEFTLLRVHLITGKSHQIRAHLQSIGHSVVGDSKYGSKASYQMFQKEFGVRFQQLHAWKLIFGCEQYLPEKYRNMELQAKPPKKFREVLRGLGIKEESMAMR